MRKESEYKEPYEFETEIKRGNFTRAVFLAKDQGLPEKKITRLRYKAIWQMAAVYRNAPGTKKLAREFGISKNELREFLESTAEQKRKNGNNHILGVCYNSTMGGCLTFAEWVGCFFEKFHKIKC